jgi:hypothetical protein
LSPDAKPRLQICAGEFVAINAGGDSRHSFDAVVFCFFLDTAVRLKITSLDGLGMI